VPLAARTERRTEVCRMTLPDFEGWAVFATVAEQRSFSGAAATLGLSKATLSKTVTRLEARLGVRLFHWTSRRRAWTDSGAALVTPARCLASHHTARPAAPAPRRSADRVFDKRVGPDVYPAGDTSALFSGPLSPNRKRLVHFCGLTQY